MYSQRNSYLLGGGEASRIRDLLILFAVGSGREGCRARGLNVTEAVELWRLTICSGFQSAGGKSGLISLSLGASVTEDKVEALRSNEWSRSLVLSLVVDPPVGITSAR